MKITEIELRNIRGFKHLEKTAFSEKINVFIGANNSGKSTILNVIFNLQRQNTITKNDITIGENSGQIDLFITGNHPKIPTPTSPNLLYNNLRFSPGTNSWQIRNKINQAANFAYMPQKEPNNLIYPYLSKRKAVEFQDQINEEHTNSVLGNFTNLYSKIDRLVTPQFQPANSQYIQACKNILGFEISTLASSKGKKAVYFVHNQEHIPLTSMGEGVTNIIGLITDLCVAENKIFLIEELENDIHPNALKSLLDFIVEKSANNQFFISTHSNIVMKNLGGVEGTKVFNITSELKDETRPNLFISSLQEIPNDYEERKKVLESLGYEFHDFGLWAGWLFLEESSAEVLIREWFIKWYCPSLINKLRTYSANSLSQVIPKFDDFNKLFVFLHLQPLYKNKVWVIIDGGENEKLILNNLQEVYGNSGWNKENFQQFSEHDFENYYPERFQEQVQNIKSEKDKQKKRMGKKQLLEEVKKWIEENEKIAKEEFKTSAKDVIQKLKTISKSL
ncbi:AAA family ATPase [Flavobacterium sp. CYK-4]|uniref:ATP-dependent nuclease n=1 Tax=Flavobacterium lotistagni TaxID=2709660 RepID=UPI00140BD6DF|nr:AAA family ATPase [Flavobacterium lotistagni]NHM08316.1 AAA family ATPase [Flavobacterium lotistagni]